MKILPVGAELFLADVRTDRHEEASSLFPQFCEKRLKTKDITCRDLCLALGSWRYISFIWL